MAEEVRIFYTDFLNNPMYSWKFFVSSSWIKMPDDFGFSFFNTWSQYISAIR